MGYANGILAIATLVLTVAMHFFFSRTLRLQSADDAAGFRLVAGKQDDPLRRKALITHHIGYVLAVTYPAFFITLFFKEAEAFQWPLLLLLVGIILAGASMVADLGQTYYTIRALRGSPSEIDVLSAHTLMRFKWRAIFLTCATFEVSVALNGADAAWFHYGFLFSAAVFFKDGFEELGGTFFWLWGTFFLFACEFLFNLVEGRPI